VTTESQRAEYLVWVRDLVVLGITQKIDSRSELRQAIIDDQLLLRVSDGVALHKTSIYRYLDALRFLKFDDSDGFEDHINWTSRSVELAECGIKNYQTYELSVCEKKIFRESIFLSDANKWFLSYFCNNTEPESQTQFVSMARPLYVVNRKAKRPAGVGENEQWPAQENVELSFTPDSRNIMRRPTREFLYTYRYWGLDTDIIDELNIKEAERCGILKTHSYVLFPLDLGVIITAQQFLGMIYSTLGANSKQPVAVPIPWLMYQICPETKISVEGFKSLLLDTWRTYRNLLHLERGPGGLIEGKVFSKRRSYSERYGNHRYYVIVDGTIRSHLVILPAA